MANKKNYNKISTEAVEVEQTVDTTVETEAPVEEAEVIVETKIGTVTDCSKLNLREKPKKDAKILKEIPVKTEVTVYPDESTKTWYKVSVNGLDGFCMKEYITLK